MNDEIDLLQVEWTCPPSVGFAVTLATSAGQPAASTFGGGNLALHVGDDPVLVEANRQRLAGQLGVPRWQWLNQVHGCDVVEATGDDVVTADACFTRQKAMACAVLTADCLPVLLCDTKATQVAVAHAGWRGLAAGVLQNTLSRFEATDTVMAYLGPAIGPRAFEVGSDVLRAFQYNFGRWCSCDEISECFVPSPVKPKHFLADLYALARLQLNALGVADITGGNLCTLRDDRFYSFRRQPQTGRMASAIWLRD